MISSIFLILLFANWFGLFPWNNSFGRTVDLRFEYVELLELDAEDVVAAPEASALTAASANAAFGTFYLDPIPFETAELTRRIPALERCCWKARCPRASWRCGRCSRRIRSAPVWRARA